MKVGFLGPSPTALPSPQEQRQNNLEAAKSNFQNAIRVAPQIHEPHFNVALLASKAGDIDVAFHEVGERERTRF